MNHFRRALSRIHFHPFSVSAAGLRGLRFSFWRSGFVASSMAGLTLFGSACAAFEPTMQEPSLQNSVVSVGADLANPEQKVLAEVYAQSFPRSGREGTVIGIGNEQDRVSLVRNGAVLVAFGCTGELLGISDPAAAKSLAEEFAQDEDPNKKLSEEWKSKVYDAFSRSLPGEVMATDAGDAQGCEGVDASNPGASLPQWVVPFYLKPSLVREDRVKVLNEIAGSLTTKELKEMTEKVRDGKAPASEVARDWLSH